MPVRHVSAFEIVELRIINILLAFCAFSRNDLPNIFTNPR